MRISFPSHSVRSYELGLRVGFAAVAMLVLIGLFLGVFRPIQAEISRLDAASQELQELIRNTSQISETRMQLEQQLSVKEEAADRLLKRIPVTARESDFLAEICQLAKASELEVVDYHPGAVHQLENRYEMEVKVSTRGEYGALCRFLRHADEVPRLCRLVQMDISTTDEGERLIADIAYRISFSPLTLLAKKDGAP